MSWTQKKIKVREDKVVVKLYDDNENFVRSIITPTILYPLTKGIIRTFTYDNTEFITNKDIVALIDTVEYKIGKCFNNCERLINVLNEHNFDVKSYAGWLFLENEIPVWHNWLVINENQIIDLANTDDKYSTESFLKNRNIKELSIDEQEKEILSYFEMLKELVNSERCMMGKANKLFFYVGTECSPTLAFKFYDNLLNEYPEHESYSNCNKKTGLNQTQSLLAENGLL